MEVFPPELRTIVKEWRIQVIVLFSLSFQIILSLLGNWRKYSTSNTLSFILWVAYLSADWSATVSLSVLSNNAETMGDNTVDPKFVITAFWAPIFLLHLGGPDTITAYSLEDNELWRRHSLTLIVQMGVAFYVFLRAWIKTPLNFLAVPMFIPGIIKIWERIWVLRSASSENFKAAMLRPPDAGPNYAKYMEEYSSKKNEGFEVKSDTFSEPPVVSDHPFPAPENAMTPDAAILQDSYFFFETFKQLFADLILSIQDIKDSQSFFREVPSDEAFKVIEIELGFMFDVFYTKAFKVYSREGFFLRFISVCSTVSVLLAFWNIEKRAFPSADIAITYALLVGAISLEIYAVLVLFYSDWAMLWLIKHKNFWVDLLSKAITKFPFSRNKRWSNTMGQYSLISYCLKEKTAKCSVIQKFLCMHKLLEKHRYQDSAEVSKDMKRLIFEQLLKKSSRAENPKGCKDLCEHRGLWVLRNAEYIDELGEEILTILEESIKEEFDQTILLWHIATNLCYHSDRSTSPDSVNFLNCEASKLLSKYMLYLLVMRPFMLPNGIEQIRFQDTCAEAYEFFKDRKSACDLDQAHIILLEVSTEISPTKVKGDRSKSELFEACRLAKSLQYLEIKKKWELVSHIWVEMLCYAASKCRWNHHTQQLTRGGELVTHVRLLMAHFGITEQFQISKGHARVKLSVQ